MTTRASDSGRDAETPFSSLIQQLILVADDDDDSRESVTWMLRDHGYRVMQASNGAEALACAKEMHPAAVVIDMFMPVLDGIQATRAMREDPELRNVPVRARTGDPNVALESSELFAAICPKPCPPLELLQLLAEALLPRV